MKNRKVFEIILNPFTRIAGWQAFGIGIIFAILSAIIGTLSGTAFDGVLDMHFVHNISFRDSFIMQGINIFCIALVMGLTGLIVAKNVRFIDILGTFTLARAPYFILAFLGFFTTPPDMFEYLRNPELFTFPTSFIIVILISLPFIIWSIALMYNGFKVSTNLKGAKLVISFIIGILIAETLSKILIFLVI